MSDKNPLDPKRLQKMLIENAKHRPRVLQRIYQAELAQPDALQNKKTTANVDEASSQSTSSSSSSSAVVVADNNQWESIVSNVPTRNLLILNGGAKIGMPIII